MEGEDDLPSFPYPCQNRNHRASWKTYELHILHFLPVLICYNSMMLFSILKHCIQRLLSGKTPLFYSPLATKPKIWNHIFPIANYSVGVSNLDSLAVLKNCIDYGLIYSTWRNKWQPTPVFLPGESHGQKSLVNPRPWGAKSRTRLSN